MPYTQEKQVGIQAAINAAKLCEQVRQNMPPAMTKNDRSPVTVADYGAQAIICQELRANFPHDPIVAEEDSRELGQPEMAENLTKVTHYVNNIIPDTSTEQVLNWIDAGNGQISDRYWTLDPIDGTKGFVRKDQYAIALALIENGEIKVGILACPAFTLPTGEIGALFVAVRGEGATVTPLDRDQPRPIRVVSSDDTANLRFVESVEASHGDGIAQNAIAQAVGITAPSLQVDSQAKYGIVASGKAALYLRLPSPLQPDYRENIWDHAAGAIIVEEAGGRVSDMYGQPLNFSDGVKMVNNRGIVVSNGIIHDQVLAALKNLQQ